MVSTRRLAVMPKRDDLDLVIKSRFICRTSKTLNYVSLLINRSTGQFTLLGFPVIVHSLYL